MLALEECYKQCSIKTGHVFYLPILENSVWKIIRYENGLKREMTQRQFKDSFRTQYVIPMGFGNLDIADSK
ncbi:MAG: hypothetical protein J6X78_01620 [Treponema sp.]|nr:hypothetical protein [Treponema sp.]